MNSGNPARNVEGYAKSVSSNWAFYVDADRSFEKAIGVQEISTSNIYQARIVNGKGDVQNANPGALDSAIDNALSTAKWKIPPAEVPDALKKAWRALEFGQISVAAPQIKQATAAADPKVKEAAKKMQAIIQTEIDACMSDGAAKATAGNKWDAYKAYLDVATNFKTFSEAAKAAAEMGKLKSDPKVAKEVQAKAMYDKVTELLASPKKTEQEQGKMGIAALLKQHADTEAGVKAASLPK